MVFRVLLTRLALHQQFQRCSPAGCKFKLPTASAALYSNHVTTQVEKPCESKEAFVNAVPTLLQGTKSLEELFKCAERDNLTPDEAVTVLNVLCQWKASGKITHKEFQNDPKFSIICKVLEQKSTHLQHHALVSGVKSVLEIGLPSDNYLVQVFENVLMWKARKMPVKLLIFCLQFHSKFRESPLQKKVVQELANIIQRRWFEIIDGTDMIKLFQISDMFSQEFMTKMEDRTLELTEIMNAQQLFKLLVALSEQKQRPKSLIRGIAFHLNRSAEKLNAKQLVGILRAITVLRFPDEALLRKISNDLQPEIWNIDKGSMISSILTSAGMIKWRHPALLEACGKWINKNIDKCQSQEFVSYLLTLGRVNYIPENEDIVDIVSSKLTKEVVKSDATWLDIVWSLCILGKANKEHVASVLNPAFYNSVFGIDGFKSISCKLKLLNIQGVAQLEMSYTTPTPVAPLSAEEAEKIWPSDAQNFSKKIIDVLRTFMPFGKFLITNVRTPMGLFIDAEFMVDNAAKAVPLTERGSHLTPQKNTPSNFHRVALLTWDYKDFSLNSQTLIGVNALTVKLLKKMGYVTIEIPYFEFPANETTLKKVQYLKRRIEESIQNTKQCLPQR